MRNDYAGVGYHWRGLNLYLWKRGPWIVTGVLLGKPRVIELSLAGNPIWLALTEVLWKRKSY